MDSDKVSRLLGHRVDDNCKNLQHATLVGLSSIKKLLF